MYEPHGSGHPEAPQNANLKTIYGILNTHPNPNERSELVIRIICSNQKGERNGKDEFSGGGDGVCVMVAGPAVMVMGELDLQSVLDKAKEAGVSQETIQQAANSDEAKEALQDGTAQQALNDAKDAMSDSSHGGSPWSDWVKSNIGLGKGSPAPSPEDSGSSSSLVGDIELSPSPSEEPVGSPGKAPASAPPEGSSPSPSLSSLSSMLSPSPSPSPTLSPSTFVTVKIVANTSPVTIAVSVAVRGSTGRGPRCRGRTD
ncbi:uncharacterized protein LOC114747129 [Neltuma alba]|uniref:uncharacterized protein LOC114747129 n=1 Tax=Neltuma alba TaxID=207710 RepID=UPI0010A3EB83|nr:uncharacterized protein LOC114747129 [Prosopis alba]